MKKVFSLLLALIILATPISAFAASDKEAPIIYVDKMQIIITNDAGNKKKYASEGDTVTVAVPVTENDQLKSVTIAIDSPSGKTSFARVMKQYEDTAIYYTSFLIDKNTEIGHWNIAKLKATDISGNYMYVSGLTEYKFGVKGVITDSDVTLPNGYKYTFSLSGVTPKVKVTHRCATLNQDVDYKVKYENNKAVGTATAIVTGIGCITGTVKKTFKIVPKKAFTVKLSATKYTYNGKIKKPAVTVYDGKRAVPKSNYTVKYSKGRKNVGKYAVKVVMKNNYSGSKTAFFTITPKGTSLTKVKPVKKGARVCWKKQSVQIKGYQIQYSSSKKFTKKTTKQLISVKPKKLVRYIRGVKSGKRYYVRIRTYKKVGGKTYCSNWSKVKTFKAK